MSDPTNTDSPSASAEKKPRKRDMLLGALRWGLGGKKSEGESVASPADSILGNIALPLMEEEPPCTSCNSLMAIEKPASGSSAGSCSVCSKSNAAEPFGVFHACMTCGSRMCIVCNQKVAIERRSSLSRQELENHAATSRKQMALRREAATQAVQVAEAEAKQAQTEIETRRRSADQSKHEAEIERRQLEEAAESERDSFNRDVVTIREELKAREVELRGVEEEFATLRIAYAEKTAAISVESEVLKHLQEKALAAQRCADDAARNTLSLETAKSSVQASEWRLRARLTQIREGHSQSAGAVQSSLAGAGADLDAELSRLQKAREKRQVENSGGAAASSGGYASAVTENSNRPSGLQRFWGQVQEMARDMDPLPMPMDSYGGFGLPTEMQVPYHPSFDVMTAPPTGRVDPTTIPPCPPNIQEHVLRAECREWRKKSESCSEQVAWMRRDIRNKVDEITSLRVDVTRLVAGRSAQERELEELQVELKQRSVALDEDRCLMRQRLDEALSEHRERLVVAIAQVQQDGGNDDELEQLFGDNCDWADPSTASAPTSRRTSLLQDARSLGSSVTGPTGLGEVCKSLENAAKEYGQDTLDKPEEVERLEDLLGADEVETLAVALGKESSSKSAGVPCQSELEATGPAEAVRAESQHPQQEQQQEQQQKDEQWKHQEQDSAAVAEQRAMPSLEAKEKMTERVIEKSDAWPEANVTTDSVDVPASSEVKSEVQSDTWPEANVAKESARSPEVNKLQRKMMERRQVVDSSADQVE